jgi:hypothetical protein
MGARVTRESDLRSLDRRSMYSIFAPLDPDERLPRELILEGRRRRTVGRRELAGILWLPALCLVLLLSDWAKLNALTALALIGAAFGGLFAFAMSGEPRDSGFLGGP